MNGLRSFILPLCFTFVSTNGYQNLVLEDLLLHWKQPLQVTLRTCWNPKDQYEFVRSLHGNSNSITFSNDLLKGNLYHRSFVVMDLACHKPTANSKHFSKLQWIFLNSKNRTFPDEFNQLNLALNSEVFYISATDDLYTITKIFKFSPSSSLIQELFGHWKEGTGLKLYSINSTVIQRWNLQRTNLKASIVCSAGDDSATKVNQALTITLGELLNATITFHCTTDWESGLVADLRSGSTDLGTTPSYMTTERLKQIHFVAMTGPLDYKFVFRSPKLSYTDNVFALTFQKEVWFTTLGTLLLATALQMIITHYQKEEIESAESVTGALLNAISITSQQEALFALRSISSRTLNIALLLGTMFLYICFSANVVSLIQSPSSRIRTLWDLMEQSQSGVQLAAQDDEINRIFMANQSDPLRETIYDRIVQSNSFLPLDEGSERIREGLFAFHGDTNRIYRYMMDHYQEDEKCNLQAINLLPPVEGYYSVAKHSPYLEHVRVGILKLRELGYQQRLIAMYYAGKPPCIGDSVFVPVSMVDAIFPIQLMGLSTVITIIILGAEVTCKRYDVKKRIQTVMKHKHN